MKPKHPGVGKRKRMWGCGFLNFKKMIKIICNYRRLPVSVHVTYSDLSFVSCRIELHVLQVFYHRGKCCDVSEDDTEK